ncbi:MAG TPA: hypothetical protein DCZ95_00190 [Verrucomicrobia bacterium]|nr:MAG: hypothetical protein A2X46_03915 [Lentisphaerae bacterium GWF2_57_35]HBA82489.1 hypothetical protein [Verrucomicrobiota bacterium]
MSNKRRNAARRNSVEIDEPAPPPKTSGLNGFLWSAIAIFIIGYVGFYLVARTDGFRSFVEDKLSTHLGLKLKVQKTSCDLALNLIVKGVASEGISQRGKAGLHFGEARIGWSLMNLLRPGISAVTGLKVYDSYLSFAPDGQGGWAPAVFKPVSSILEKWSGAQLMLSMPTSTEAPAVVEKPKVVEPSAKPTPDLALEALRVAVRNGRVTWWMPDGNEMAVVEGVRLDVQPIAVPDRQMMFYRFDAHSIALRRGFHAENLRFELLRTEGQDLILSFTADWGAPPKAAEPSDDRYEGLFRRSESDNFTDALKKGLQKSVKEP